MNTIEITVEGPGGLEAVATVAGGDVAVGAGTVTTVSQARQAVEAGAVFLVCPHLDPELMAWAADRGTPLIPGAWTPSEIAAAGKHEPPAVKLFPANVGGPDYVKTLLGPYPNLRLIPTGGVTAQNAGDYLSAGAVAVGVGSWLTRLDDEAETIRRARLLRGAALP
ncbi:MAG: bifunctional 4-hydroxy-2-oxoglutarate aldolase/2-dehydro-3-deoxy-phosphogluconate aldolase [Acidimicrobiia bacterium]